MTSAPERPRQVTLAAGLIMGGSVIVVISAFQRISGLTSLESQEAAVTFLSEPPGEGLGLSVDSFLTTIRVLCLVAAACATATAILGYQVLQRSRSARLALSVLALPLFVAGMGISGFVSSLVAVAVVMLWFQPARDWYAGVSRPAQAAGASGSPGSSGSAGSSASGETPSWPPPLPPSALPPTAPETAADRPADVPSDTQARPMSGFGSTDTITSRVGGTPQAPAGSRPTPLLWACILTWGVCGLAMAGVGLSVLAFAAAPDLMTDELNRQNPDLADQGLTDERLRTLTFITGAIFIPWCLAAIAFAVQAFRRVGWARVALLVSAAVSGGLCLLGTFGSVVLILPALASVATVALLLRPEVRAWFRA